MRVLCSVRDGVRQPQPRRLYTVLSRFYRAGFLIQNTMVYPLPPLPTSTRVVSPTPNTVTCRTRHLKGSGLAANPRSGNADDPNDGHHRRSVCTGHACACDGAEVSRRDATRTTLIAIALRFAAEHALPHAQAGDGLGVRKACCKLPFRVELFRGGSFFRVVLAMNRGASAQ